MKKLALLISFAAVMIFTGCASTTQGGAVGIDRSQFITVSEAEMDQSAALAYRQITAQANAKHVLNTDKKLTDRVRGISRRLIAQVGAFRKDALKWNWQVNVINDPTINAWCMPGGRIVVYTGIIEKLKLTDAELAAILGHEMSHALREHSRERASTEQMKDVGIAVASSAAGLGDLGSAALNMAAQYTFTLPFSRTHETEADLMGVELMARAGYDPRAAINVWEKMNKLNESHPLKFMSTHPSNDDRIADLKEVMPKVLPLYEAATRNR